MFAGADGVQRECSEGMMVIFDAGETHTVCALHEKLVYIAIYKEVPTPSDSLHREMLEAQPDQHAHKRGEKPE